MLFWPAFLGIIYVAGLAAPAAGVRDVLGEDWAVFGTTLWAVAITWALLTGGPVRDLRDWLGEQQVDAKEEARRYKCLVRLVEAELSAS